MKSLAEMTISELALTPIFQEGESVVSKDDLAENEILTKERAEELTKNSAQQKVISGLKQWAAAKVKVCKADYFTRLGKCRRCKEDSVYCLACQRTMHDFELTEEEVAHA